MTFLEALQHPQVVTGELWFRPVGWKGWEKAHTIENGEVILVPDTTGGTNWLTPRVKYLLGDWEIVTPHDVCEGR